MLSRNWWASVLGVEITVVGNCELLSGFPIRFVCREMTKSKIVDWCSHNGKSFISDRLYKYDKFQIITSSAIFSQWHGMYAHSFRVSFLLLTCYLSYQGKRHYSALLCTEYNMTLCKYLFSTRWELLAWTTY